MAAGEGCGRTARVVVVGSGLLARAFCYAYATVAVQPTRLTVLARSRAKATEVANVAQVRAAICRTPASFAPEVVNTDGADELDAVLDRLRPDLVLVCASYQSPWEAGRGVSEWSALLASGGFGVTLPLQAGLALNVAAAVKRTHPEAVLVNAAYPDAVNPVLAHHGLPALCGIGNVGLLADSLQCALGLDDQSNLLVLAHHVHLKQPSNESDEALVWREDSPVGGVTSLLAPQRSVEAAELNHVTGCSGAQFVAAWLAGQEIRTSLPGPLGLPGGYPVRIRGRAVDLRLPPGFTRERAVAWNLRAAARDGVVVTGSRVEFAEEASRALRRYLPDIAAGFDIEAVADVCATMRTLRDALRTA